MTYIIRKLAAGDIDPTKQLIRFFLIDDGIENPALPSDEYVSEMLLKPDFHVIVAIEQDRVIGGLTAYEMKMFKRETTEMFLYEIAPEISAGEESNDGALCDAVVKQKACCYSGALTIQWLHW